MCAALNEKVKEKYYNSMFQKSNTYLYLWFLNNTYKLDKLL